ncbi:MAG: phosphotransferase family protein [Thermoleophilaceae bacterium]
MSSALATRLREVLGGPVEHLAQLSGGASRETWVFDLDSRGLILQLDRVPADEAPGRGARPPQAPLLRAAARAGVPVASVVAAGEDDAVLGPSWTVVERLPGTADPRAILAGDGVPDAERLLDGLAAALAAVHRMELGEGVVPHATDPLADLRSMHDELGQSHPTFELAFRELDASRPATSRTCVVHGDFRMGNVLVGPDGVTAVLDWELTHAGDPLEDLGWICVPAWRFGRPDRPAAGLGSREQLVTAYERHAGTAVDREALRWWELFGRLKWGVICVVQAFTHLSGAAHSLEHAVIGRRACEVEWDLLEALDPGGATREIAAEAAPPAPALHDRPTAPELLDATRAALGDDILPLLEQRAAFQLRVALRALGMVERELRHDAEHSVVHAAALRRLGVVDEAELATAVRSGAFDERRDDLLDALRTTVRAKLQAANPRYLKEVARDS